MEICKVEDQSNVENYIEWDHRYSLKNWIYTLKLYCSPSFEIGFFGSCFFIGYVSSCLVFPPLADKYGRKKFILLALAIQGTCFLVLLFVPNMLVYYVVIFIFGSSVPLKNMIAYTHLMEFLPGRVGKMSGYMIFLDGMILVVSPLVILYITHNTAIFLWIGLTMNLIGLSAFVLLYIPESIKFQLENAKFESALKDIQYVMKFNKTTEEERVQC